MEEVPQEESESQPETVNQSTLWKLISRLNVPFLIVATITGLVASNSDPWWTISSQQSSNILRASVSPFFVHIIGLGTPTTVPNADIVGLLARAALVFTAVALAWQGFFPQSFWRKPVLWLSLTSWAGQFLVFSLFFQSTQSILLQQYGFAAQLSGSAMIPGIVIGTDLVAYASPTVSSSLSLPFFASLGALALLGTPELVRYIFSPSFKDGISDLVGGLAGAVLSPPYQNTLLTSTDQTLNPLAQDPDKLNDDELATSFERLLNALQPGATVSVILPPWATKLSSRLAKVVPWTGFNLENSQVIFRTPGKPENELVFRKPPAVEDEVTGGVEEESTELTEADSPIGRESASLHTTDDLGNVLTADDELGNDLYQSSLAQKIDSDPTLEAIEEPVSEEPERNQADSEILSSARRVIERSGEPVPYQELLDQVSLDMMEQDIALGSENQVEETLLGHVGKEFAVLERPDEEGGEVEKAWWFGEDGKEDGKFGKGLRAKLSDVGKRFRKVKEVLDADNTSPESSGQVDEEEMGSDSDEQ